jgi:hypothetical protein
MTTPTERRLPDALPGGRAIGWHRYWCCRPDRLPASYPCQLRYDSSGSGLIRNWCRRLDRRHPHQITTMTSIFRTIALELSKALLKLAIDRALRKELPGVFATKLDWQLPKLIGDGPDVVRAAIGETIASATKHPATAGQINGVIALYDPTAAADRAKTLADAVGAAIHKEIIKQQRPGGLLEKMTYASVRSAAEHIARTGKITPQQLAAFSGLDGSRCQTRKSRRSPTYGGPKAARRLLTHQNLAGWPRRWRSSASSRAAGLMPTAALLACGRSGGAALALMAARLRLAIRSTKPLRMKCSGARWSALLRSCWH